MTTISQLYAMRFSLPYSISFYLQPQFWGQVDTGGSRHKRAVSFGLTLPLPIPTQDCCTYERTKRYFVLFSITVCRILVHTCLKSFFGENSSLTLIYVCWMVVIWSRGWTEKERWLWICGPNVHFEIRVIQTWLFPQIHIQIYHKSPLPPISKGTFKYTCSSNNRTCCIHRLYTKYNSIIYTISISPPPAQRKTLSFTVRIWHVFLRVRGSPMVARLGFDSFQSKFKTIHIASEQRLPRIWAELCWTGQQGWSVGLDSYGCLVIGWMWHVAGLFPNFFVQATILYKYIHMSHCMWSNFVLFSDRNQPYPMNDSKKKKPNKKWGTDNSVLIGRDC